MIDLKYWSLEVSGINELLMTDKAQKNTVQVCIRRLHGHLFLLNYYSDKEYCEDEVFYII